MPSTPTTSIHLQPAPPHATTKLDGASPPRTPNSLKEVHHSPKLGSRPLLSVSVCYVDQLQQQSLQLRFSVLNYALKSSASNAHQHTLQKVAKHVCRAMAQPAVQEMQHLFGTGFRRDQLVHVVQILLTCFYKGPVAVVFYDSLDGETSSWEKSCEYMSQVHLQVLQVSCTLFKLKSPAQACDHPGELSKFKEASVQTESHSEATALTTLVDHLADLQSKLKAAESALRQERRRSRERQRALGSARQILPDLLDAVRRERKQSVRHQQNLLDIFEALTSLVISRECALAELAQESLATAASLEGSQGVDWERTAENVVLMELQERLSAKHLSALREAANSTLMQQTPVQAPGPSSLELVGQLCMTIKHMPCRGHAETCSLVEDRENMGCLTGNAQDPDSCMAAHALYSDCCPSVPSRPKERFGAHNKSKHFGKVEEFRDIQSNSCKRVNAGQWSESGMRTPSPFDDRKEGTWHRRASSLLKRLSVTSGPVPRVRPQAAKGARPDVELLESTGMKVCTIRRRMALALSWSQICSDRQDSPRVEQYIPFEQEAHVSHTCEYHRICSEDDECSDAFSSPDEDNLAASCGVPGVTNHGLSQAPARYTAYPSAASEASARLLQSANSQIHVGAVEKDNKYPHDVQEVRVQMEQANLPGRHNVPVNSDRFSPHACLQGQPSEFKKAASFSEIGWLAPAPPCTPRPVRSRRSPLATIL